MAFVQAAAESEEERKAQFTKVGFPAAQTIRSSYFSDSIVYSCAAEREESPWLVYQVSMVCALLLKAGLYTRGAITVGRLLHDDSQILGEGLVRAYSLEQSVAFYPRLIASDEAVLFSWRLLRLELFQGTDRPRSGRTTTDLGTWTFFERGTVVERLTSTPAQLKRGSSSNEISKPWRTCRSRRTKFAH